MKGRDWNYSTKVASFLLNSKIVMKESVFDCGYEYIIHLKCHGILLYYENDTYT